MNEKELSHKESIDFTTHLHSKYKSNPEAVDCGDIFKKSSKMRIELKRAQIKSCLQGKPLKCIKRSWKTHFQMNFS